VFEKSPRRKNNNMENVRHAKRQKEGTAGDLGTVRRETGFDRLQHQIKKWSCSYGPAVMVKLGFPQAMDMGITSSTS
jgi:hypothetical protein